MQEEKKVVFVRVRESIKEDIEKASVHHDLSQNDYVVQAIKEKISKDKKQGNI